MRVAVIGSGVSGLAATWLLNECSPHEVHLYEADDRPGGHANTVDFSAPGSTDSPSVPVDTGFIVFNPSTYPNFLRFLRSYTNLKHAILPTEMTFSVSRDGGIFEWAGKSLGSVFCQPARLVDRKMWRMLYDILRFNTCATRLLLSSTDHLEPKELSIGEYLKQEGYSTAFKDNYLIPMTAAIWSTPPDKCALDFPARTLIQFMSNHHLLQITGKPSWLTLQGGSRIYVERILASLPSSQLHLKSAVHGITSTRASDNGPIEMHLKLADESIAIYDHVIMACHSDTTMKILQAGNSTEEEERILGSFKWSRNEAVLHFDTKLMPKRRPAWSCWNYLTYSAVDNTTRKRKSDVNQIALTYWMNDLQHISEKTYGPILVTLNPPFEPSTNKIVGRYSYDHPVLDTFAVRAQDEMNTIQNKRGISYAGAWMKYGFHEDGFTSGLRAAMQLPDVRPPFEICAADRNVIPSAAAFIFDFLERSGVAKVVGSTFGLVLDLCSAIMVVVLGTILSVADRKPPVLS